MASKNTDGNKTTSAKDYTLTNNEIKTIATLKTIITMGVNLATLSKEALNI